MDKRNRKRSENGPGSPKSQTAKRFQVPRACRRCKSLRRGCDETRPCKRCIRAGQGNDCIASSSPAWALASTSSYNPESLPFEWVRAIDLAQSPVVDECIQLFFELCHPTIPILTPEYVQHLRDQVASHPENATEAAGVLVALCAFVLLHVESPTSGVSARSTIPHDYGSYGATLLDAATAAHRSAFWTSSPSLDGCLLTFFLYASQTRMSRHSQTFLYLRQACSIWVVTRERQPDTREKMALLNRLFWVLLASERSHAIRYSRAITLHITPETPDLDFGDPSLAGLHSLAALFRPIDSAFMALLNREKVASSPSAETLDAAERSINTAIPASVTFQDMQKANLRVTKLWLRNVIWQLRLHLGFLRESSHHRNLTYQYPLDIAKELILSTRDLPIHCIRVHGVGLTEKLFDIASAVVDVMAGIPHASASTRSSTFEGPPEDDLTYIRRLILQLPGGPDIYDGLLEKHIQQALPSRMPPISQELLASDVMS